MAIDSLCKSGYSKEMNATFWGGEFNNCWLWKEIHDTVVNTIRDNEENGTFEEEQLQGNMKGLSFPDVMQTMSIIITMKRT